MPRRTSSSSFTAGRRWTETEARAALDAQARSRLSMTEYATREGLDVQRLQRWRRRLAVIESEMPSVIATRPTFVELTQRTTAVVEVLLARGRTLRVSESIAPALLRRLVEALDDGDAC